MFNPDDFKKASTTAEGSTKIEQCPVGDYIGKIDKVEFRQAAGKKNPAETFTFMDVTVEVDDEGVRKTLGREKVTVRGSGLVDLTADGKGFDMAKGKNVFMNRVRDAVGQNVAGQEWAPFMLEGKVCKIAVRPQKNDPEYNEVASFGKL